MDAQTSEPTKVEQISQKLSQYFGDKYDVSSNKTTIITVRSGLEEKVYIESEDITVIDETAFDFGLRLSNWKLIVALGQLGLYCEFEPRFGTRPLLSRDSY